MFPAKDLRFKRAKLNVSKTLFAKFLQQVAVDLESKSRSINFQICLVILFGRWIILYLLPIMRDVD